MGSLDHAQRCLLTVQPGRCPTALPPTFSPQIAAQTRTFILAGYETTASALAYTVYCLALNPRAEAALLAEVDAWGRDKAPAMDDLAASFPYVDACIKEALRLYPPATLAIREAKEDLWLGGHHVPAGTSLHVSCRVTRFWALPLLT